MSHAIDDNMNFGESDPNSRQRYESILIHLRRTQLIESGLIRELKAHPDYNPKDMQGAQSRKFITNNKGE